jgi:hypothetical protein
MFDILSLKVGAIIVAISRNSSPASRNKTLCESDLVIDQVRNLLRHYCLMGLKDRVLACSRRVAEKDWV